MNLYDITVFLKDFFSVLATVSLCLYFFVPIYSIIGFFVTKKFPEAKHNHKYAIMIAARNEEAVIGNLIDSINSQDYPSELVTVFVVADNCTDSTAQIARDHGAVCYERFDSEHRTKGYALEFLVENIARDYGIESFEAYFIFDADNLLKKDYLSRMNEAFDSGEKIVTSYRNTKNFGSGWIAASYGIHWLRTIRYEHRGRAALGLATRIQGTGFMFASEIIKGGWHYVSFTEDRALAADAVVNGYRISYCDRAEFYDEQPTSLRIALRQRIRWGKGHLQAFVESGPKLLTHVLAPARSTVCYPAPEPNSLQVCDGTADDIYADAQKCLHWCVQRGKAWLLLLLPCVVLFVAAYVLKAIKNLINHICAFAKKNKAVRAFISSRFFKNLKLRFMSYDMFIITFPNNLIVITTAILSLVCQFFLVFLAGSFASDAFSVVSAALVTFAIRWAASMMLGIYVFFVERKRIAHIGFFKKIYYCIMWPMFDIIGKLAVLSALFMKVEWKPIPHTQNIGIDDIIH